MPLRSHCTSSGGPSHQTGPPRGQGRCYCPLLHGEEGRALRQGGVCREWGEAPCRPLLWLVMLCRQQFVRWVRACAHYQAHVFQQHRCVSLGAECGSGGWWRLDSGKQTRAGGEGLIPAHVLAPPAMPLLPPERSPIWLTPQRAKNLPSKGLLCHNEFWMFLSSERNEACSLTLCTNSESGVTH